jgi:thiamine biosynthesis protein ThiS
MTVFLNGEAAQCEEGLTIAQLLERHGLPLEATLVERNGVALHRREWPNEKLRVNDRLEILRVAAGG